MVNGLKFRVFVRAVNAVFPFCNSTLLFVFMHVFKIVIDRWCRVSYKQREIILVFFRRVIKFVWYQVVLEEGIFSTSAFFASL